MSQERILKEDVIVKAKLAFPNKPTVSSDCKEFLKRCLEFRAEDRYSVQEAIGSNYLSEKTLAGDKTMF